MNETLLLVVVALFAALGGTLAIVFLHWRIAVILDRALSDSHEQLLAVDAAWDAAVTSKTSLAQLEMEDRFARARAEGAKWPLEQVRAPGAHASNDALAHALRDPGDPKPGFQRAQGAPERAAPAKRPCFFCQRVRAYFSRRGPSGPVGGS